MVEPSSLATSRPVPTRSVFRASSSVMLPDTACVLMPCSWLTGAMIWIFSWRANSGIDLAASSDGMLRMRGCAAAGKAGSEDSATPQASQYLRFDAIIPLRLFTAPCPEALLDLGRLRSPHLRHKSFDCHSRARSAREPHLAFSDA